MSTERLAAVLTAVLVLAPAGAVHAAVSSFVPTVDVSASHTTDLNVTGDAEIGATSGQVSLTLPYTLQTRLTSYRLAYRTSYRVYQDFSEANHGGHHLSAALNRTVSTRATFGLHLTGSRTRQRGPTFDREFDLPDEPASFVPDAAITRVGLRAQGRFRVGERSNLTYGAGGTMHRFSGEPRLIFETGTVPLQLSLVDSQAVHANLGWGYSLSHRTTLGLGYSVHLLTFDEVEEPGFPALDPGEIVSHSIYVEGDRQFGTTVSGNLQVGVFRADRTGGNVEVPGLPSAEDKATIEPRLTASLTRTLTPNSSLSAGLHQNVGAGNGLAGGTIDRGGFVGWSWSRPRPAIGADVTLSYYQREPLEDLLITQAETRTVQLADRVSWKPRGSRFSYGAFHSYRDQSAEVDPGLDLTGQEPGAAEKFFEANGVHTVGVYVSWNILGRVARPVDAGTGTEDEEARP